MIRRFRDWLSRTYDRLGTEILVEHAIAEEMRGAKRSEKQAIRRARKML